MTCSSAREPFGILRFLLVLPGLFIIAPGSAASADEPSTEVRAAVDRGLAFLSKDALAWRQEKKCLSCHHAPMGIWSLNEGKKFGYAVDDQTIAALNEWILADSGGALSNVAPSEPISINQAALMLALGFEAGPLDDAAKRDALTKMLQLLLERQRADGSWGLSSLFEPIGSTPDVMTSLVLLSLTSPNAPDMGQPGNDAREKGLAWLSNATAEQSLQGLAVKALLWKRLGYAEGEWQPLVQRIRDLQRPDGGWGQINDLPSDAYATGMVLYVLADTGTPADDPAIMKGRAFLIGSQEEAGTWRMGSRPKERDNTPSKNLRPIVFSGTAWAVMGLMHSAPPATSAVTTAK